MGAQVPRSSSNSMGSPEAMATHSGPACPRWRRGAPGQGLGAAGAETARLWGHRHFLLGEAAAGGGAAPQRLRFLLPQRGGKPPSVRQRCL